MGRPRNLKWLLVAIGALLTGTGWALVVQPAITFRGLVAEQHLLAAKFHASMPAAIGDVTCDLQGLPATVRDDCGVSHPFEGKLRVLIGRDGSSTVTASGAVPEEVCLDLPPPYLLCVQ